MAYSPELLQGQMDRLRKLREGQQATPEWTKFQPQQLSYQTPQGQQDTFKKIQNTIMQADDEVTATALIKAQNAFNYQQMLDAREGKKLAQQNYIKPQDPNQAGTIPQGGNASVADWGKDRIPEVSDLGQINADAPLRTMTFKGMQYTVNSQVAPIFQAFLRDLWKMGYHPKTIGGHSDRDIGTGPAAGQGVKSLHSYGLAIDIDPGLNPVAGPGGTSYALPPSVAALAAKYGLSWGGNWNSYKDYMHFSVPYGGRE